MKNNQTKFLPFNIQFFAEEGGSTAVATGTNATNSQPQATNNVVNATPTVNYDEIFKKLDAVLDKRSEGITKSVLKDNGYEDAEMKDILTQYRASKQAKANEADNQISTLTNENAHLKATLQKERLNNEALKQAASLNVDDKTVPYLIKMADLSKCLNDKGEVNADEVKTALETVLNDIPSLKQEEKGMTGVQVGANTQTSTQPSGNVFGFNFTGVRSKN